MNDTPTQPLLLIFVGMPGAGKSSSVEYVRHRHGELSALYFGGITVDEVKRRGLEVNEPNERAVREEIRAKEGKEAYAKRIAQEADALASQGQTRILIDGLYSWSEYTFFKERYGDRAIIVAIVAPRKVRHQRLLHRPVRPLSEEQATAREYAEIEHMEKGGPIANADYTIVNDTDTSRLFVQVEKLLQEIAF